MLTDAIGDMLTRIRNAQKSRLAYTEMDSSTLKVSVLNVLKREGYIKDFEVEEGAKPTLKVLLKYNEGVPVIKFIKRISKPGRRVYTKISKCRKAYNGLGIVILSTPKGVMSDHQARRENVGGEILCEVF